MYRNLNNLQYLSLMSCLKFTDRGLGYLATGKGAKQLAYLDLSYCQQVNLRYITLAVSIRL